MIERVERERLWEVSWVKFAGVGGESFLTAHCVRDEVVRRLVREAFGAPRVLSNWVYEFDGAPAAERDGQPLGPEGSAKTINWLIIVSHHHQMIDVFDAVQTRQTLTAAVATNRLAFRVGSQSIEHVNRDGDALIGGWDKIVWAVQASFHIPEQMFRPRAVDGAELRGWQPVVVRVAQRIRLQRSALLLVVKHESAIDKLHFVHFVRWTGAAEHNDDLTAGWYERLGRNEIAQIVSGLPRCRRTNFEQRFLVSVWVHVDDFNYTPAWWWSAEIKSN